MADCSVAIQIVDPWLGGPLRRLGRSKAAAVIR